MSPARSRYPCPQIPFTLHVPFPSSGRKSFGCAGKRGGWCPHTVTPSSSRHRATRENGRRRMRPRRGQSASPRGRLPRASWRDPVGRRGDGAYPLRTRGGARSAGGPLPRRTNRRRDLDPSARPGPSLVSPRNAVRRAHGTPSLSFSARLSLYGSTKRCFENGSTKRK